MPGHVTKRVRKNMPRLSRRLLAVGLLFLACAAPSGCGSLDLRGDRFAKDETFEWSGQVRPPDEQIEYFGFSNKARQIEREFGAR